MKLVNFTNPIRLASNYIEQYHTLSPPQQFIKYRRAHADASGLQSLTTPPSLKDHKNSSLSDKTIWDQGFLNEYLGLTEDINTWEYIT